MARLRDRIFAGMGALLFFGSACALTVFVVLNPGGDTTADTQSTKQACVASGSEESLPAPDAYQATEPVTELQSTDLTKGSGAAAKAGDCLVMKYYGMLAADGSMFEEDFTSSEAFAFTLGQGQVIEGWDQGLVGMKAGGMRRLVIPASLAYKDQANGKIPANADLVFVVKLVRIQK